MSCLLCDFLNCGGGEGGGEEVGERIDCFGRKCWENLFHLENQTEIWCNYFYDLGNKKNSWKFRNEQKVLVFVSNSTKSICVVLMILYHQGPPFNLRGPSHKPMAGPYLQDIQQIFYFSVYWFFVQLNHCYCLDWSFVELEFPNHIKKILKIYLFLLKYIKI